MFLKIHPFWYPDLSLLHRTRKRCVKRAQIAQIDETLALEGNTEENTQSEQKMMAHAENA